MHTCSRQARLQASPDSRKFVPNSPITKLYLSPQPEPRYLEQRQIVVDCYALAGTSFHTRRGRNEVRRTDFEQSPVSPALLPCRHLAASRALKPVWTFTELPRALLAPWIGKT
jgi:hypothetical protein